MKCAGCIATEIHQCYRKSCTCMECNPCSLTVGTNEMLARIEALEGALEKIRDGHSEVFPMQQANDFELRGFAARALLPAPRKEDDRAGTHDLRAVVAEVKDPLCTCGHLKSRHDGYEDHDECRDCDGGDEQCSHYEAPLADGWEYSCARCGTRDAAPRGYEAWECSRCGAAVRPLKTDALADGGKEGK